MPDAFCGKCATPLPNSAEISHTKTLKTPIKELTRGTTFAGRYEIIEELGKGGMGKVYRVFDNKIEAEVALKLVRPEIAADKKTVERFKNELKLARDITHKNVCRMYDLNEEQGTHYITMEYISGGDLKRFIKRSKQLGISTAISIAKQICEGLAEAHELGVVHRDLKPNNIMIDDNRNARIMDFGIARSLSTKGLTGKGVMIGTPEYMAPEQVEGKDVDQRSDIYSLGIILYEMVTGRVPFEGDTPFTIGVKHKSEIPKDPKELNAQLTYDFSSMIMKCLEKERGNRYQNTGAVLSVLNQIEQGIPTTEREAIKKKTTTSKEITVTFGLKKILIPAIAVVILAILAGLIFLRPAQNINPNRILVALFEDQTGDESLAELGGYAAHWISQGLSQIDEIEVVPHQAVLQSSRAPDGEEKLAEELGAGILVSGIYYLVDGTLTFHVNIIETRRGQLIHELDPVGGPLEKKLEIIEDLRNSVMGSLA
ncbi:MAG: serine/threonine protein kinase, partial [Desulfobacteraceae bacterium]|nr:serine/threonine protein kinase [Desulfobacteraceae bacterium]